MNKPMNTNNPKKGAAKPTSSHLLTVVRKCRKRMANYTDEQRAAAESFARSLLKAHVPSRPTARGYEDLEMYPVLVESDSPENSSIREEFERLSAKWKEETARESSMSKITSNLNYLQVIRLGKGVIPFILHELQETPAPWFLVLRVLTQGQGTEALGQEFAGNYRKIADCWIKWWENNNKP